MTSNPAHTSVRWVKTLNNVETDITVTNSNKYSGGSVNTPSLTISSAASADGGYYKCYASNSVGTGQSQSTFLNVVGSKWCRDRKYHCTSGKIFIICLLLISVSLHKPSYKKHLCLSLEQKKKFTDKIYVLQCVLIMFCYVMKCLTIRKNIFYYFFFYKIQIIVLKMY